MYLRKVEGKRAVRLANGSIMTQADLPPAGTRRWVASRKEAVVVAVENDLISKEKALQRWQLSEEEFAAWSAAYHRHGTAALKVTKLQRYRQPQVATANE